jgi:hypothetical protein
MVYANLFWGPFGRLTLQGIVEVPEMEMLVGSVRNTNTDVKLPGKCNRLDRV